MVNPFNPGPPTMAAPATADAINTRHIRQFINRENLAPKVMVNWLNAVQQLAEGSRLGIPVLFVTNPRNTFGTGAVFGIAEAGSAFSQWPGTLGLAAMRDPALVEEVRPHRRAGICLRRLARRLPPDCRRGDRTALESLP